MSEHALEIVRWVIFAVAILSLLQATILFRPFQRYLFDPWVAFNERAGGQIPAFYRDERFQRGWPLLMAALLIALWWFLGTPAGANFLLQR